MAVGDTIIISQQAQPTPGTTPYFSYTTTVDMVVTGWNMTSFELTANSWIDNVQGYYQILQQSSHTSLNDTNAKSRLLIESGMTLQVNSDNDVNRFGIRITGFEI